MGLPKSRFVLFHRLVLLPPLVLLTLTCLYTSSTLSPFSTTHRLSFSQDVQCFSCHSSSFPSRSFLSLANFPASSYITDVVLRQNILKVEDSRGEAITEPASRRDADEVESENGPDEVDFHLDTSRRVKEEVGLPEADEQPSEEILTRQQESFDDKPTQPETKEEEVVLAREEPERTNASEEKATQETKVEDSVRIVDPAPSDDKSTEESKEDDPVSKDNATPSDENPTEDSKEDDSVSKDNAAPSDENPMEDSKEDDSLSKDNAAPSDERSDKSSPSEKNDDNSVPSKVDSSVPEDKNGESSVKIVHESWTETKENFDEGKKEDVPSSLPADKDVDSSVPEEKSVDSSVQVSDVPKGTEENSEGGRDVDSSVPADENVDSPIQIKEFSTETKEDSEAGGKEDVNVSVPEDKNADRSVEVVEKKENFEDEKEDLQLENRHLTSDDHASESDEHLDASIQESIEANVSSTETVPEPTAEQKTPPALKAVDVMNFGHENMSDEHKIAGIAVQKLMDAITKSGLPLEIGNSPPDETLDANLFLRGGSPQGVALPEERSCDGRRVFVYNLPSKFNADLVGQCDTLLRWFNFCEYFMNEGLGTNVPTDERNDLGEKVLVPDGSWFLTHQYALELIFHARLKHYSCLTTDVNQANLFFVPYYAGLDVIRWHFQANVTNDRRDELTYDLMTWLEGQESWSKNNGIDHVFVLGKIGWDFRRHSDAGHWGSKLLRLPSMWPPTKLLIERDPWHNNDVGVPHPTFFHPKDDGEIRTWLDHVEQSERRYLVSFAGMPRPNMLGNVRGHLIQQCLDHSDDCFLLRCVGTLCLRPDSTMNLFLHSHFCMQPPGDSPTRRSVFDSLVGGCIPVLFDPYTAYYQYPWHLPQNSSSYSVFIPSNDVMSGKSDIVEILKSITPEERTAMRTRIIREIIPGLLYSQPGTKHSDFRDAFDISMEALLHRVAHLRAQTQLSM